MDFVAIDVETANWDKSSICQVGWSLVKNGLIIQNENLLIDPQTYFDPFNVSIHGITEVDVEGAPSFADVRNTLHEMMNSVPVISYGLFDQAALDLADDGDPDTSFVTEMPWVNGQRIVRRAWPEHFKQKYSLGLVADTLGLKLQAHDAGSDAQVLAQAILLASEHLEMDFEQLFRRAYQPLSRPRNYSQLLQMDGKDGGPLSGEMICFTGALGVVRTHGTRLS